jgi:hypothetical protein
VGVVANTLPRPFSSPDEIQDIRALTPLMRWRASHRVQRAARLLAGAVNWLVTLPLVVLAWMYEPRLFWICLVLGLSVHVLYAVFHRLRLFGLATGHVVLSIGGLLYARGAQDFGSPEHAAAVTDVFGQVLWWGTCGITVIAALSLAAVILGLAREFLRDGIAVLIFVTPGAVCVTALVLGLSATSSGEWSALHLLWITPVSLIGSFVLFLLAMFVLPSEKPTTSPCPNCGKALATPDAQQCLYCGADWHGDSARDGHDRDSDS